MIILSLFSTNPLISLSSNNIVIFMKMCLIGRKPCPNFHFYLFLLEVLLTLLYNYYCSSCSSYSFVHLIIIQFLFREIIKMQLSFIILFFFVAYVTSSPSPPPAGMENEEVTDGCAARETAPEASTAPDANTRVQDSSCPAGTSYSTSHVESEVIDSVEFHVITLFIHVSISLSYLKRRSPSLMMSLKVVLRCLLPQL